MKHESPTIVLMTEAGGGVTRHLLDMYSVLKAYHPVKLVVSPTRIDERYEAEMSALNPADVFHVPMQRNPGLSDLVSLRHIRAILRDIPGPKILHAHSTKAGLLGTILRGTVDATVLTPHAYRGLDPEMNSITRLGVEAVEQLYSSRYDRIVVLAPAEMEYACRIGIRQDLLQLIPNGISVSNIDWQNCFAERSKLHDKPVLGFVGRLAYQKNPSLFIKVLAGLVSSGHDVSAIIVGEGPLKPELELLAEQCNVHERIVWKGGAAAYEYYPLMDIKVHTSRYEGMPYSILEACANLLPVVATSNPGSEAILRPKLPGQLYDSADIAGIVDNIKSLLTNDKLRHSQMRTLQRIALEHSNEVMVEQHRRVYAEVLK